MIAARADVPTDTGGLFLIGGDPGTGTPPSVDVHDDLTRRVFDAREREDHDTLRVVTHVYGDHSEATTVLAWEDDAGTLVRLAPQERTLFA